MKVPVHGKIGIALAYIWYVTQVAYIMGHDFLMAWGLKYWHELAGH